MRNLRFTSVGLVMALGLGACAQTPAGPHVQVLPAQGKPFEVFAQEQTMCKQYAADQVNGQAQNANERAVATTVIGAALGAGIGAAVGGGHGAGVGAAVGGGTGTVVGASSSEHSNLSIQQQYDNAYSQCMYAKGNQVIAPVAPVRVIQYAPPPPVVYAAPPPVVYAQPPAPQGGYAPPPPPPTQGYAPPPPAQGYAPPPGAVAPPPGTPAP